MLPCLECKGDGSDAYTEVSWGYTFHDQNNPFGIVHIINHWHDIGREMNDLEAYVHGHIATSGDVYLKGPTRENVIRQWNERNRVAAPSMPSILRRLWNRVF